MMTRSLALAGTLLSLLLVAPTWMESRSAQRGQRTWPPIVAETKPWTRWWWQGSAVDKPSLTTQLDALAAAGIGGVELTPIYGVRGAEDRFISYLSPEWMTMFDHAIRETTRLGMRVDMATGTGWPFGGPWVDDEIAARSAVYKTWTVAGGGRLTEAVSYRQAPFVQAIGKQITDLVEPLTANKDLQSLALEQVKYPRDLPLATLMAYSDAGEIADLTSNIQPDGRLDWTAPPGRWTLYALFVA